MYLNTNAIQLTLESAKVKPEDRSNVCTLAAAKSVAFRIPVPAEPVASPSLHFTSKLSQLALEALGEINERVVIDFQKACDTTKRLWLVRYGLVHNPTSQAPRQLINDAFSAESHPSDEAELLSAQGQYPTEAMESLVKAFMPGKKPE